LRFGAFLAAGFLGAAFFAGFGLEGFGGNLVFTVILGASGFTTGCRMTIGVCEGTTVIGPGTGAIIIWFCVAVVIALLCEGAPAGVASFLGAPIIRA
jgi:hypothetical protein